MTRFSLETGLRRSNVTGLLWSQVDLARRTAWVLPITLATLLFAELRPTW